MSVGRKSLDVIVAVNLSGRIAVFPKDVYERKLKSLEARQDPNSSVLLDLMLNYAEEQTLDKAGRFRVPPLLAEHRRLERDVVVYGSGDYLEIVNKVDWHADLKTKLEKLPELRLAAGV